ncbi:MAG: ribosome biogenesis GTPase YlqF [Eubacteriales bacterium]|nr:ribosome biogenesis GTPase YlqF [Eubacteriales bacterium]
MEIQWYPGHMAKAKRTLIQQLSTVNLAVELCDARLPLSSRNPDLDRLLTAKRRVLLLCKADLAEPDKTKRWLDYFAAQGIAAMAYDATPKATKQARALIAKAAEEIIQRGLDRGMKKTIRAMVVGVPNVGKSTFINRLYGGAVTEVGDRPGVTRANRWVKVGPYLEIMDTPGMLWPKFTDKRAATRLAYIGTIRDAVYDQQELCLMLLRDLLAVRRQATCERYKINNPDAENYALIDEVCRGRGFLLKGGVPDTDRACAVILDEFRDGKVGRITLELPPEKPKREAQADDRA